MATQQDDARSWSDFVELRKLLFEREFQELETLRTSQGPPEISSETLSDALPPAIVRASRKDSKLAQSLTPIVEEALDGSIKRHPQKIVEAIFPGNRPGHPPLNQREPHRDGPVVQFGAGPRVLVTGASGGESRPSRRAVLSPRSRSATASSTGWNRSS